MVTVLGAHRCRYLVLVQLVQGILEGWVVDAWACEAEITAIAGRTWVLGEFLGQCGKVLSLGQTLLDLFDTGLGLCIGNLVVDLDEDMRGMALFGQVGDFLLVQGLEFVLVDLYGRRRPTSSARCNR